MFVSCFEIGKKDGADSHKSDKEFDSCDISQVPSNVDLLTFQPNAVASSKKSQVNAQNETKKNQKGKKLLQFLKLQNDRKESASSNDLSLMNQNDTFSSDHDLKSINDISPPFCDPPAKNFDVSSSENDSSGHATSGSFKSEWTPAPNTSNSHRAPQKTLNDVSEEQSYDSDVVVAEGNLGRKISVKSYSPTPEAISEKTLGRELKRPEGDFFKSRKSSARNPDPYLRECKSSLAKHESGKLNSSSESSTFSPNQDYLFSPRREVFGQILELENEDLKGSPELPSQTTENNVKKTVSSTLHMPTITFKSKLSLNTSSDGPVVRASASGAVDHGLILSQVKPITLKLEFTASLLGAQH